MMTPPQQRATVVTLVDEAVAAGARRSPACRTVGINVRTLQRWRPKGTASVQVDQRPLAQRAEPPNKLSETERQELLKVCNQPDRQPEAAHHRAYHGGGGAGAGVKTNLLFFTKGKKTERIWYYDLSWVKVGKKTPLTLAHFGFGKEGEVLDDAALPASLTADWQADAENVGEPFPSYARRCRTTASPKAPAAILGRWILPPAAPRHAMRCNRSRIR